MTRSKQIKLNMIQIEKQLNFLLYHLVSLTHLAGEDLGHKPGEIEKALFEYFPLGKAFNKGLGDMMKKKDF